MELITAMPAAALAPERKAVGNVQKSESDEKTPNALIASASKHAWEKV